MCLPMQTIPPPTAGTQKAVKLCQMLALAEVVVVLLKLIVIKDFAALFELFLVFILYMAWAQLNACNVVIFVLYTLQQLLYIFMIFGTRVQLSQPFFGKIGENQRAPLIVLFILFFYYIGANYVAFLAYKEFKIFQYENSGGIPFVQPDQNQQQQQPYYQQQRAQPQAQPQPTGVFQGRGIQIG